MSRCSWQRTLVILAALTLGVGAAIFRLAQPPKRVRSPALPDESLALARRGYRAVPAIVAARFLAERLPGRVSFRTAVPSVLLAASWPALIDAAALFISPSAALNGASVLPGLAILTATNALMLAAAWLGWRMFVDAVAEIDELIGLPAEKDLLRNWIARRLRQPWQFAVCIVAISSVMVIRELNSGHSHVSLISQIVVGWSTAVGANTLYWIVTWAEGPARLHRCTSLKLNWYDGTRTPGIRYLQRIYSFMAIALGVGVLAAEGFSLLVADKYGSAMPSAFWSLSSGRLCRVGPVCGRWPVFLSLSDHAARARDGITVHRKPA